MGSGRALGQAARQLARSGERLVEATQVACDADLQDGGLGVVGVGARALGRHGQGVQGRERAQPGEQAEKGRGRHVRGQVRGEPDRVRGQAYDKRDQVRVRVGRQQGQGARQGPVPLGAVPDSRRAARLEQPAVNLSGIELGGYARAHAGLLGVGHQQAARQGAVQARVERAQGQIVAVGGAREDLAVAPGAVGKLLRPGAEGEREGQGRGQARPPQPQARARRRERAGRQAAGEGASGRGHAGEGPPVVGGPLQGDADEAQGRDATRGGAAVIPGCAGDGHEEPDAAEDDQGADQAPAQDQAQGGRLQVRGQDGLGVTREARRQVDEGARADPRKGRERQHGQGVDHELDLAVGRGVLGPGEQVLAAAPKGEGHERREQGEHDAHAQQRRPRSALAPGVRGEGEEQGGWHHEGGGQQGPAGQGQHQGGRHEGGRAAREQGQVLPAAEGAGVRRTRGGVAPLPDQGEGAAQGEEQKRGLVVGVDEGAEGVGDLGQVDLGRGVQAVDSVRPGGGLDVGQQRDRGARGRDGRRHPAPGGAPGRREQQAQGEHPGQLQAPVRGRRREGPGARHVRAGQGLAHPVLHRAGEQVREHRRGHALQQGPAPDDRGQPGQGRQGAWARPGSEQRRPARQEQEGEDGLGVHPAKGERRDRRGQDDPGVRRRPATRARLRRPVHRRHSSCSGRRSSPGAR